MHSLYRPRLYLKSLSLKFIIHQFLSDSLSHDVLPQVQPNVCLNIALIKRPHKLTVLPKYDPLQPRYLLEPGSSSSCVIALFLTKMVHLLVSLSLLASTKI